MCVAVVQFSREFLLLWLRCGRLGDEMEASFVYCMKVTGPSDVAENKLGCVRVS